jgi:hypothetical protein
MDVQNQIIEVIESLPENIKAELKKIEDKDKQFKELQNQIIENVENNPNLDGTTKYNFKHWLLNQGFYGKAKSTLWANIANKE